MREEPRGSRAWLAPDDEEHARKALRLQVGHAATGLDGRGGRWPLRVERRDPSELVFECTGEPERCPAPGESGSGLPWVEVLVSLPRGGRADDMFERLVQLGVAVVTPLVTERTQGFTRELAPARRARFERLAREACKQSRRAWLPALLEPVDLPSLASANAAGSTCVLSPRANATLLDWAAPQRIGTRAAPWRVVVGAEGGFTDAELRALSDAHAQPVSLGPTILRIETAAEAALAILAHVAWSARQVPPPP